MVCVHVSITFSDTRYSVSLTLSDRCWARYYVCFGLI